MKYYLVSVVFLVTYVTFGQNAFDLQDLSNLEVDQLTDKQIGAIMTQAESQGYGEEEIILYAQTKGLPQNEIDKLIRRIQKLGGSGLRSRDSSGGGRLRKDPLYLDSTDVPQFGIPIIDFNSDIYGLSFFRTKEVVFEPSLNIPTPQNYQLGPGDEVLVDVWGAFEYSYSLFVNPEGAIRVPDLGPIYLNGLTISEAQVKIKSKLKRIYSTLGENAFVDVSLGQIRTIQVNVIGEALWPGSYVMSSFGTAFNAIYLAGGPTEIGSLRKIDVLREGELIKSIDFYEYLFEGSTANNVTLQDQDVVLIRPFETRVSIYGEVKRPGIYELENEEKLAKVLSYCGGFSKNAYSDRISLMRNVGSFRSVMTIEKEDFQSFSMTNGDSVLIKPISGLFANRVRLEGAVFQPGDFQLRSGMTLTQLLEQAGGLKGDAFMDRAVILRQKEDYTLESVPINLREALNDPSKDLALQNEDHVVIRSVNETHEEYFVQIKGEIREPGNYPFIQGQTVEELILLAGGFKETAAKSFVEVARRDNSDQLDQIAEIMRFEISENLALDDSKSDFVLQPFDLISVRKTPYTEEQIAIEIEGEVIYPGNYALSRKDQRISEVLERAGGLTDYAYARGATLVRRTIHFQEEETGKKSDLIRQQELKALLARESSLRNDPSQNKTHETIAIDLEKILRSPGSLEDLILEQGDIISIPRQLQTVKIRGEVLYPSNVRFTKTNSFRFFISQSGGFTNRAKKSKSYVIYPNASAKRTKSFFGFKFYPKIEPGSEIIVPEKPIRVALRPGEIVGITSGLATLALIVSQLINQN